MDIIFGLALLVSGLLAGLLIRLSTALPSNWEELRFFMLRRRERGLRELRYFAFINGLVVLGLVAFLAMRYGNLSLLILAAGFVVGAVLFSYLIAAARSDRIKVRHRLFFDVFPADFPTERPELARAR
jgi:Mn2+/Fe2+ NRAMP family transporter